jgi:hypothetical protein
MNIEQVGIGLLCVSQTCMWWRNHVMARRAAVGNTKAIRLLDCAREAACAAETNTMHLREHQPPNRADFGALRDEIRIALERMPKKRNLRKPKAPPPEASKDSVGSVSS